MLYRVKVLINVWNCFYALENKTNCSEKKFRQTAEVHFSNIGNLFFYFSDVPNPIPLCLAVPAHGECSRFSFR